MATRSIIAKSLGEGQAKVAYCHWDGYPSYVGRILLKNYDAAKLDELLALGDLSVLGENIGEKHDFGKKDVESICTFYGRDRGEEGTDAEVVSEEAGLIRKYADKRGTEYVYLLRDNQWFYLKVYGNGDFVPLTEEVISSD